MDRYKKGLLVDDAEGWQQATVVISPAEVPGLPSTISLSFFHKPMGRDGWLGRQLAEETLGGSFTAFPGEVHLNGSRVFDTPSQCDTWVGLQHELDNDWAAALQQVHRLSEDEATALKRSWEQGVPAQLPRCMIAALQIWSDKLPLTLFTGLQAHPIAAGLLNFAYNVRIHKLEVVGFAPVLDKEQVQKLKLKEDVAREVDYLAFSKCIRLLLEPCKELSHSPAMIRCPDNVVRPVACQLMSTVADEVEGRPLAGVFAGHRCVIGCNRCKCPSSELSSIHQQWGPRTEAEQTNIVQEAQRLRLAGEHRAAKDYCKENSTHPILPGIFGFARQQSGIGNSLDTLTFEAMHADDLGVGKHLVVILPKFLTGTFGNQAAGMIRELNIRKAAIRDECRAEDWHLPNSNGAYFGATAKVMAKEHRAVFQVLPDIVNGISEDKDVNDKLCELMCRWADFYMEKHRKNRPSTFTEDSLVLVDELLDSFHKLFMELFAEYMPSGGNFCKMHKQSHFTSDVRLLGHPRETSANFYEYQNKHVKSLWRSTNGQLRGGAFMHQMIKQDRLLTLLDDVEEEAERANYVTAYTQVAETGLPVLTSSSMRISLSDIESGQVAPGQAEDTAAQSILRATQKLVNQQPELAQLPLLLRRYLWDLEHGAAAEAAPRVQRITDTELPALASAVAHVSKGGCFAAQLDYLPSTEAEVQSIRATTNFYRRPWFDAVAVHRATGARQGNRTVEYAQLRLLFTYKHVEDPKFCNLALVRWYQEDRRIRDVLSKHGCKKVRWAAHPHTGAAEYYEVINLLSLKQREFVVPDFAYLKAEDEVFTVSAFKWSRRPHELPPSAGEDDGEDS